MNSGFKITFISGDDLLEVSDDDDSYDFISYVQINNNVKVTLFVVNSTRSGGVASGTGSNKLGSGVPFMNTPNMFQKYHTQGIFRFSQVYNHNIKETRKQTVYLVNDFINIPNIPKLYVLEPNIH